MKLMGIFILDIIRLITKKKNKIVDSPEINKPDYHLYSNYEKGRRKESGELNEITLFGKRIRSLTIKEALFILEPLNYIRGKEFFKNNFIKCNDKKVNDIISPMTKENLKSLDINIDELPIESNIKYSIKNHINKDNSEKSFEKEILHSPEFYFKKLKKKDFEDILVYADLIRKDMQELNSNN
jgi:hypothetical protein